MAHTFTKGSQLEEWVTVPNQRLLRATSWYVSCGAEYNLEDKWVFYVTK